jgi:hypothetical protein
MTLKKKTLLASLTLTLVFPPACKRSVFTPGPGQHVGQQDKRVFSVYLYTDPAHPDQCLADWPVATLWQSKHQTVKWISDDDKDYFVDFTQGHNGSPFAQMTFVVPKHGAKPSGDLIQSGKYYDYAIRAGTSANAPVCKPPSDPGLYVK